MNIKYQNLNFTLAFQEYHPLMPGSFWAMDAFLKGYQRLTTTDVAFIYSFTNSELTGYMEAESSQRLWDAMKGVLSADWMKKEMALFETHATRLKELVYSVRGKDLNKEELVAAFRTLREETGILYPYSNAFYLLSMHTEEQILSALKERFGESEANVFFTKISKPAKETFLMRYFRDIRKIAVEIVAAHGVCNQGKLLSLMAADAALKAKLQAIRDEYFCLTSLSAGERTIESLIPDIVQKMIVPEEKAEDVVVPTELQDVVSQLQSMIYFKDELSTFTIPFVVYGFSAQWKKAASLLGVSLEELNCLTLDELIDALAAEKADLSELIQERKKGAFFFHEPWKSAVVTEGEVAIGEMKKLASQDQPSAGFADVTEIKGKVGSPGKVTGIVMKVMHSSKIADFKEGFVLVSTYTAPEFVPAMQKALAIVTDTGGIVCHAAIVSRELGKPCVVGTKIATKVLNDGDEVEVDAEKGIITIIKRA